jgi:hypothetical protein
MKRIYKIDYIQDDEFLVDYDGMSDILQTYDQIKRTAENLEDFEKDLISFMRVLKIKSIRNIGYKPTNVLIFEDKSNEYDESLDDMYCDFD